MKGRSLKGWISLTVSGLLSAMVISTNVDIDSIVRPKGPDLTVEAMAADEVIVIADIEEAVKEKAKTPKTGGDDSVSSNWHFYNQDLQNDGSAENDYNFGPNPVLTNPDMIKNVSDVISKKGLNDTIKMSEIAGDLSPEKIDADFRERMRHDPALTAADVAAADAELGTRHLGVFRSESKEQWDKTMNTAKERFMRDKSEHEKTLGAFFKLLDSATKVEVKQSSGLTDQMYMDPYTVDGVPDIIVMESKSQSGWFIEYTFTIKGTTKKVRYRLDCGYQPVNVAVKMNIKKRTATKKNTVTKVQVQQVPVYVPIQAPVQQTAVPAISTVVQPVQPVIGGTTVVNNNSSSKSSSNVNITIPNVTPITPITPVDPDPITPDEPYVPPIPTPVKDPTKGSSVLPNDPGSGSGEDTNGDDNESTKDQPSNSNHMTEQEYNDTIKENEDANSGKEGGDSNEPSTPPPSDNTNVDDNSGGGNGSESIDKPTEKSESSVDHDSPGDSWDGPPD